MVPVRKKIRGVELGIDPENWLTNSLASLGILVPYCLPDTAKIVCVCVCAVIQVETGSQPQMSLVKCHPHCFMRQGHFIDLEVAGWQTEGPTSFYLPSAGRISMHYHA